MGVQHGNTYVYQTKRCCWISAWAYAVVDANKHNAVVV